MQDHTGAVLSVWSCQDSTVPGPWAGLASSAQSAGSSMVAGVAVPLRLGGQCSLCASVCLRLLSGHRGLRTKPKPWNSQLELKWPPLHNWVQFLFLGTQSKLFLAANLTEDPLLLVYCWSAHVMKRFNMIDTGTILTVLWAILPVVLNTTPL